MVIGTHARIANQVSRDYFYHYQKGLVILGSVLPDFNCFSQPHRGINLSDHIRHNEEKITNTPSYWVKYVRLGNMLHYLCDYFCYAHKDNLDISHGTKHTAYELAIGRIFKEGFGIRLHDIPSDDRDKLWENLQMLKENYEKKPGNFARDLKYAMTAVEYCMECMATSPSFEEPVIKTKTHHVSHKKRTKTNESIN